MELQQLSSLHILLSVFIVAISASIVVISWLNLNDFIALVALAKKQAIQDTSILTKYRLLLLEQIHH